MFDRVMWDSDSTGIKKKKNPSVPNKIPSERNYLQVVVVLFFFLFFFGGGSAYLYLHVDIRNITISCSLVRMGNNFINLDYCGSSYKTSLSS